MLDGDTLMLRQVPYFCDLQPEELALVERYMHRRVLTAGQLILLEGTPAEGLYLVCAGRVRVFRSSAEGREQVLFVAGPGTTFNDVAAFDGGTNLANAQAMDPGARIILVPTLVLARLLAADSRLAMHVIPMLAGRMRQLAALVEDVSLCDTTQRIARLLQEEAGASGIVRVNRQELAARTGTVREVVSRTLRHLERMGAITRQNTHTLRLNTLVLRTITDPAGRSVCLDTRAAS